MSNEIETFLGQEETEAQMCQAMADRMNEDGMDVSAEDVQHAIDSVAPEATSPPSEEDEEVLAAMVEYQKEYLRQNPIYVVRGALLYCSCGSHCRMLNLPQSHGVYILNHAAMHAGDNVGGMEGPDLNITTFGICSVRKDGGSITLKKEAERDKTGLFTGVESTGTINGAPCLPQITQQWQDTHADSKIGVEKLPALTTISFLMCERGGTIGIWRSGQEDTTENTPKDKDIPMTGADSSKQTVTDWDKAHLSSSDLSRLQFIADNWDSATAQQKADYQQEAEALRAKYRAPYEYTDADGITRVNVNDYIEYDKLNKSNPYSGLTAVAGGIALTDTPVPGPADLVALGVLAVGGIIIAGVQHFSNDNKLVSEILKDKKGSIKNAPLPPGTPGWEEIALLTLEQIRRLAKDNATGFKTILKLLTDGRFNR